LPVQIPHQAMEGRWPVALVLLLHRERVALQVAEPGPADRNPAAHTLTALVGGLGAEPDQRLLAIALVAENLRALLRQQQLGLGGAYPPAGQLIEFQPLYLGLLHGCVPYPVVSIKCEPPPRQRPGVM